MNRALIVVDVQNDFCSGGALAVPGGNKVIPVINKILCNFNTIVFTQDWHPANHGSFASNNVGRKPFEIGELNGKPQMMWPDHCIQNTFGAALCSGLNHSCFLNANKGVIKKGQCPTVDSYSGFFDNDKKNDTGLARILRHYGIEKVYICGLATDYCVKFTAIDSVSLGFETSVIVDACRGVNMDKGDVDNALKEMASMGIDLIEGGV